MKEQDPASAYRRTNFATKKGETIMREHEYDGIQELDQKLPNWWLFTLYTAIIFFLVYWLAYYQLGIMQTDQKKVTAAISAIQGEKNELLLETLAALDDKTLVYEWATNRNIISEGESIYKTACIACHGSQLDAPQKLGLSLVDHQWKYGDKPMDIFKIINEGSPIESKGMTPTGARMIPWGQTYTPDQIAKIVAFIISKNPQEFKKF
jgi:cytochrome c oxidase cbb3-type subunit 3